jgi:alpha-L-fucosidase
VTGVNLADYVFKINGVARRASSITTPWWSNAVRRFNFAKRWVHKFDVITVSYTGTATVTVAASTPIPAISNFAVVNNSIVLERAAAHVGRRVGMFIHWGMNTFTGLEWGDGTESPSTFAPPTTPTMIDNWIACAKAMGATYIVLTAKHHDGFCLWPSATTTHSLSGAPWYTTGGGFNIVQEFVTRCNAAGIAPCIYYSVWDRNYDLSHFGDPAQVATDFTKAQIGELLSYGPVGALWTDGWGSRNDYPNKIYSQIYDHIKALQPGCILIENNHRGDISNSDMAVFESAINGSVPSTNIWPGEEADTVSNMGWFWKSNETLKSSATIIGMINTALSRRCSFLVNCPPNPSGLIPDATAALMSVIGNEVGLPSYDSRTATINTGGAGPSVSVF